MPLERICFGGNLEALKREARDLLLGKGLIVEKEEHAEKASGQIGLESERKAVDSSSRPTVSYKCMNGSMWHVRVSY